MSVMPFARTMREILEAEEARKAAGFKHWATLGDVRGTGCMFAPNAAFRIDADDIGSCHPRTFDDMEHLRRVLKEHTRIGGRAWLWAEDVECHVPKGNSGDVIAKLCFRGPIERAEQELTWNVNLSIGE